MTSPPPTPPTGRRPSDLATVKPSRPQEDLSKDPLLLLLPRDGDGRPVAGRIPLVCRIGKGGMGAVYYAVHPRLNVEVAVKILPPHLVDQEPRLADRFVAEARMAAALASEHVVRVLDVDQEGSTSFLVMEYVEGESAGGCLKRARSEGTRGIPESEALEIVAAATRGLAAAHARGIVHRDIKPDNILIPQGLRAKAKLADLGLAKPEGGQASLGTQSHVAMGTPGYMAPEQIEDARSAGPAADVFSMGATLYALLTGRAPFSGSSLGVVLRDTATKEPAALPDDVSAATRALVRRCLEKDPSKRFANGSELLQALEALQASPATLASLPESARPTLTALPRPPARASSGRLAWLGAAAVVLIIAAIVGYFSLRTGSGPPPLAHKDPPPALGPPPTLTLDLGGGVTMDLVYIKPGTFTMGGMEAARDAWDVDERPAHAVTITKGYYLGKCEVTRGQFEAFVKATGYTSEAERDGKGWGRPAGGGWAEVPGLTWRNGPFTQTDAHPAMCISWNDARVFCDWATKLTGHRVRLPTEAEWEYACRAGTVTNWSFGDSEPAMDDFGWHDRNSGWQTHAVGLKKPNAWGLYDMHGNVWEWCQDPAGPYAGDAVDPAGPASGDRRIIRGGDWSHSPASARSARRYRNLPQVQGTYFGFRVAVSPDPPSALTLDLGTGVTMEFVYIKPGSFTRGGTEAPTEGWQKDERPAHPVTIAKGYYLGKYEVTQAQWEALMGSNPSKWKAPDLPVERVSWDDCQEFLKKLSGKAENQFGGHVASLPTEAEWEYACRAGTTTRWGFGDEESRMGEHGWFSGNSGGQTHPVGLKKPNAWGLHDMHGNVWEWCQDWWGPYTGETATDPEGPPSGGERCLRGGGWTHGAASCRSAIRGGFPPPTRDMSYGLRVAIRPGPPGTLTLDLGTGVSMDLIYIKPGTFTMGGTEAPTENWQRDERPPHPVTITKGYYLGKYEVTQAQWEAVMGSNPSQWKGSDLPVELVSWDDCQDFLKRLNEKVKNQLRERVLSLPTEAEWEYACRAGTKTGWSFGDDESKMGEHGWFFGNSAKQTHPVGRKKPNGWGLYDMHGNVWEWCQDWWGPYTGEAARDPEGPTSGSERCLRGGCWSYGPVHSRSAIRYVLPPWRRFTLLGLRVAAR